MTGRFPPESQVRSPRICNYHFPELFIFRLSVGSSILHTGTSPRLICRLVYKLLFCSSITPESDDRNKLYLHTLCTTAQQIPVEETDYQRLCISANRYPVRHYPETLSTSVLDVLGYKLHQSTNKAYQVVISTSETLLCSISQSRHRNNI